MVKINKKDIFELRIISEFVRFGKFITTKPDKFGFVRFQDYNWVTKIPLDKDLESNKEALEPIGNPIQVNLNQVAIITKLDSWSLMAKY